MHGVHSHLSGKFFAESRTSNALLFIAATCLTILPGRLSAQIIVANGFGNPKAVAVDGNGNVYVADSGNGEQLPPGVYKETFSDGHYTQASIGSGFVSPAGVAVDRAGNVYVADYAKATVYKLTLADGSYSQTPIGSGFAAPAGLAVDRNGNVYVADTGNGQSSRSAVYKLTPSNGGYVQTRIGSGWTDAFSVALDGAGNVYIADANTFDIYKETLSDGKYTETKIASDFGYASLAADESGNVYVANGGEGGSSGGAVYELTPVNNTYIQSNITTEFGYPQGVAVDLNGSVYIADDGDSFRTVDKVPGLQRAKSEGGCDCAGQAIVPHPIDIGSGNMWEHITDYTTAGQNPLAFQRFYNSQGNLLGNSTLAKSLGVNWRSNFDRYLQLSPSAVVAEQADGHQVVFLLQGNRWTTDSDVDMTLAGSGSRWTITDKDDNQETYEATSSGEAVLESIKARNGYTQTLQYGAGQELILVTDSYGRELSFTYSGGLLETVTTPDKTSLTFGYAATNDGSRLTSVSYSTTPVTSQTYHYANASFPFALTSITDENGNTYAQWTYDFAGRAITSQLAGGVERYSLAYFSDGTTTVTNASGVVDTYSFTPMQGIPKVTQINRAKTTTTAAATETFGYDGNGYLASQTDWNGNLTTYVNDSRGLPTTINEAVGSSMARTTTIAYDPKWVHLPARIVTPGLTTTFAYDSRGELLTKTLTDTTTITSPYATNGATRTLINTWSNSLLASVETPNKNTTKYGYDGSGALISTTDATGHVTKIIAHTGGGLPETIVDPNQVTTTLTYSPRQWLTSSTITGSGPTFLTTWTYDAAGNRVKTTLPDNSYLANTYDNAHRLIKVTDALGNYTSYSLDLLDDLTKTAIYTSGGSLTFTRSGSFNALGRLQVDVQGQGQKTVQTFDPNGNVTSVTDGLSHKTTNAYDALNRLSSSTDATGGVTSTTYDAHDRITSVTDPNGNPTSYLRNGFGDVIQQTSPDSGTTVFRYDGDSNVTQKVDAAGIVTNHTYDGLDRILTTTYPADSAENVIYKYDQPGHGFSIGKLTTVTDAAGSLSRTYGERGNIISETRTNGKSVLTTSYDYDGASRIVGITYPSGAFVAYNRDAAGYVTSMPFSATNADASAVGFFAHLPFGPVYNINYNNGDLARFSYYPDYRMHVLEYQTYQKKPYLDWTYGYDADSNVQTITDDITSANSQLFGYDPLNRLVSATSKGTYGAIIWAFDHNGNMTDHLAYDTFYNYTYTHGTNRLATATWQGKTESFSYTPSGNISKINLTTGNLYTMGYNKANRLDSVTGGDVQLAISGASYDAFGKRITKANPGSAPILYSYDLDGHLIEEDNGGVITDYIYMDGINVANWEPSEKHLYFINFDSRGVPQMSRDEYGLTNWAAYSDPDGLMTATVNSGQFTGPVTQNLRLPGQYFDHEDGLHYNGFRDYMPGLGRYLESDPIGIAGGLNPYLYANANPGKSTDPTGTKCVGGVGCWTTPEERAYLQHGDYLGYYGQACTDGDSYACFAFHVANNDTFAGHLATNRLMNGLRNSPNQCVDIQKALEQIRLNLAEDYANYLPQSEADAIWPDASSIAQFHWAEFAQFGLSPSTFGGTPFGKTFGVWGTGSSWWQWPHWFPDCQ